MENNISKEFYLLCKEDGITKIESKADVARMILAAKNNGFNYSETELKEMFEEGKLFLKQEQEIIRNEKKQEKITELRSIELKHIEEIKVISKYIGTEKPISVLQKQISELQQELYSYSKQERDAQELGLALYKAGEIKEKDWAIHGGIASGLAGGAAGLATALDIQQQNAQAREHNKQLMSSVVRMQMGATSGIYEAKERINEKISKLRNEIDVHKKRLVEELQPRDLLIKLNPQVKRQKYTETGAIELKIETQPTPNLKIYDEITAVVDGSFKALLIDGDDIVGEVLFALPDSGATRKNELIGYCVDTERFNSKVLDVVFVPINLWAIETNEEILNQDSEIKLIPDYTNFMLYYSAKDILRKSDKGIKEYEDALWLLECIPNFEKAKVLAKDCKTQIEAIKEKEEAERIKQEKRAQAEKEERTRIAKRNKKFALITTPIIVCAIAFFIVLNTFIIPSNKYNEALALAENEKYAEAIFSFNEIINFKDSREKKEELLSIVRDNLKGIKVDGGYSEFAIIKKDGKIISTSSSVRNWEDIVDISVGSTHIVGVIKDGSVIATGENEYGQCNVMNWEEISKVSAGSTHTIGLKKNGTVLATKYQSDYYGGACDVENWNNIIDVSTGMLHTLGLKNDGTVVATKFVNEKNLLTYHGQCDVQTWTDIIQITAGMEYSVGLKKDGTVVAVGDNDDGQCNVKSWEDIVSVATGSVHTVGLKKDGTVVAVGDNKYGQCNVDKWTNIIAIAAGRNYTVGLRTDGVIIRTVNNDTGYNQVFETIEVE